jgi:hypothetical protein
VTCLCWVDVSSRCYGISPLGRSSSTAQCSRSSPRVMGSKGCLQQPGAIAYDNLLVRRFTAYSSCCCFWCGLIVCLCTQEV